MSNFFLRLYNGLASRFTRLGKYYFYVDGLGYRITSMSKKQVVVSSHRLYLHRILEVPEKVTYNNTTYTVCGLSQRAFAHTSLQQIVLPETIAEISDCAFLECKHLTHVFLPCSLKSINTDAFHNCPELNTVRVGASEPPIIRWIGFDGATMQTLRLEVPKGSLELYRNAAKWKDFVNIVPIADKA